MDAVDLQEIELGYTFTPVELSTYFRAVWGAVSWPGKRAGFAVVIGMDYKPHFDSHDVYLLDEYESFDLRKLVRQCGALDLKYGISLRGGYGAASGRWMGEFENNAASKFIEEINTEQHRDGSAQGREPFSLTPTLMLEMENLYSFILPQLKDLLTAERRQLFLKDSKIVSYLSEIEDAQISELQPGDYPAIEALAFAVIELRDEQNIKVQEPSRSPWSNDILTRGFKCAQRRRG